MCLRHSCGLHLSLQCMVNSRQKSYTDSSQSVSPTHSTTMLFKKTKFLGCHTEHSVFHIRNQMSKGLIITTHKSLENQNRFQSPGLYPGPATGSFLTRRQHRVKACFMKWRMDLIF